ncbi:MAG: nitroreductase family protein, partial [Halobacteria archaeon]|nr:nitroreductase family protein [Halobacteria archaeon]
MSSAVLNDQSLDTLFRQARSHNAWQDKPVNDDLLKQLYDLMKKGPTSANSCPRRFVFINSAEA